MSISHDLTYAQFSPEELRVADYDQGRKYGDGNPNLRPAVGQPTQLTPLFENATLQQTTQPPATGANLFGDPTQQQTTQPPTTGTSLFGSVITTVSHASTQPVNTFVFPNLPGVTSSGQASPSHFRPSQFGGIGGAGGVLGGAPSPARPTFQSNPPVKKPELRPGDFGYSPTIIYPPSDGKYLDGIPRSESIGVTQEVQDAHQDALLHLCIFAESIIWPPAIQRCDHSLYLW